MALPNSTNKISVAERRAARERDASQATGEYQAEQARVDANMTRLRELRLAKVAADTAANQMKGAPDAAAMKANTARSKRSAKALRGARSRQSAEGSKSN